MSGLIGKKIGMTSVFNEEGKNIPCTVIEAGPCVVTQVKTVEKDGYSAVQIAYDDKAEKNTNKCLLGHFKKAGVAPKRKMAEFGSFEGELNLGDVLTVDVFETHGQHNRQRKPGSLGASSYPSRVFKGKRLPGQTGGDQVKVLNLRILKKLPENNLLLVKGSIPGAKGSYLLIED